MHIVINNLGGFLEYLLFTWRSESGLFQTDHITTDDYNLLHIILVFLTDIPKTTDKRKG